MYYELFQADHDTFIIMENLKEFLRGFNSSHALFAGSLYLCRSAENQSYLAIINQALLFRSEIPDCNENGIEDKNEVII